jgi:hypothetical protein
MFWKIRYFGLALISAATEGLSLRESGTRLRVNHAQKRIYIYKLSNGAQPVP